MNKSKMSSQVSDVGSFHLPTEDELAAIERIKTRFYQSIEQQTDKTVSRSITEKESTFLRFYRGQKRNEDHAVKELIRYNTWRLENQVDDLLTLRADHIQRVTDIGICHLFRDKANRPSTYGWARKHNARDRRVDDFKWYIIFVMERILTEADAMEQRGILTVDLKGFSLMNADYELAKVLFATLAQNYPETIHRILIVDALYLFSAVWAVVRPWVDPVTATKIAFIKNAQLTEYFNEEDIPRE
jgi:hypothetical protein